MNFKKFVWYTGTGGAIWMSTLIGVGYFIGGNKAMIRHYMPLVTTAAIGSVVLMIIIYVIHRRKRAKREKESSDGMAG